MVERSGRDRTFSRKKFLIGAGLGAIAIATDQVLKDGIMFDEPSLEPELKKVNLTPKGFDKGQDITLGLHKNFKPLSISENTFVYYNTDNDLIFQHNGAIFDPSREYRVSHRGGNRRFLVDKSLSKGANGLDIDAVTLSSGAIIAEHGIVGELRLGPISLGATLDKGEQELRTRIPRTVVDMLSYISSKSDPDDPLMVEVELKRGPFDNQDALFGLVSGIVYCNLPLRVSSNNQPAVDNLYNACIDYSQEIY